MIKNKPIKITLFAVAVLLIIFQALVIGVAAPKEYQLIYDWIFYGINFVIIAFLFFLLHSKNQFMKWMQWGFGLALLVANTTFFIIWVM